MRLPQAKLLRLRKEVRAWQSRRAGRKRDLLLLIGSLQHAASVVPAGRSFVRRLIVRRLIDASKDRRQLSQWVRLNAETKADLRWWGVFLERWNGRGFFSTQAAEPRFVVRSDASGSWGGLGVALVSVAVVGAKGAAFYCAKGAALSPAGGGAVGPSLVGRPRVARVRQHGGSGRRALGFQQRRDAYAFTANAAVLRRAF